MTRTTRAFLVRHGDGVTYLVAADTVEEAILRAYEYRGKKYPISAIEAQGTLILEDNK